MKKQITEKDNEHEIWYKEARDMTLEKLPDFLKHLMEDYALDYGTITYAFSAGAIATMWAMNKEPQGGITGFQASCVLWNIIKEWSFKENKTGLRLINFDNMLYPQYEKEFTKTMRKETWEALQKQARVLKDKADEEEKQYKIDLVEYVKKIKIFTKKHPDYTNNPKIYERLHWGDAEAHIAYEKKVADGFEFAPEEPFHHCGSDVYKHWCSIIDGKVPFGYKVETEK